MNSTRTAALLITGTVCAAVVTAAGTTVHAETPSSAYVARHAPQVDIEASTYASAATATPNRLYGNSIRSLPAGYYVAPVGLGGPDTFSATDRPDGTTRVSNPSLSFAPSILPGSTTDHSGQPTRVVGSVLTPDASPATSLGLFSPTGAFLGLVGVWAIIQSDLVEGTDVRWLLPVPWVFAGIAGLLATTLTGGRRHAVAETGWVDTRNETDEDDSSAI